MRSRASASPGSTRCGRCSSSTRAIGALVFGLYRRSAAGSDATSPRRRPRRSGRRARIVVRLAALFSVDAFAGGLVVNSLLSLWLFERFGFSLDAGRRVLLLDRAAERRVAARRARASRSRIGLLNTMVFTHIPANVCLIAAALAPSLPLALALLFVRSALSQMDVPTRTAYVMAVVTPAERTAAASFTAVPRSLAAALSPTLERRAARRRLARAAAGRLRRAQDRLRPDALARDAHDALDAP